MAEDIACAVVIDTGAGYCKADLSFEDNPKCIFPTVVGKPKINSANFDNSDSNQNEDFGDLNLIEKNNGNFYLNLKDFIIFCLVAIILCV